MADGGQANVSWCGATGEKSVRVETVPGPTAGRLIADLARLRVAVFRDYPYLYDGDLAYEEAYLQRYARSPQSAIVAATVDGDVVGAATCLPLADETEEIVSPFRAKGYEVAEIFYFGESVLLPPYRGLGIGVAFFSHREAWARSVGGFRFACFCRVERPHDDPKRPKDYAPLDNFWRKRAYAPVPGLTADFSWRELGATKESEKRMSFWMKALAP